METKSPRRKSIRLSKYDYSKIGYYFITICTKNKEHILSQIETNNLSTETKLSKVGLIVKKHIKLIENIYDNIRIDEYIIMPNHIHIILIVNKNNISISRIIQQLKRCSTKEFENSIWQKSFYEHIIRNEYEYLKIKEYIINNPINWEKDKYF